MDRFRPARNRPSEGWSRPPQPSQGRANPLPEDGGEGLYRRRSVSTFRVLEAQRPKDVVPLKLLLKLEAVALHELREREPGDLPFVGKPARSDQPLDFLGELVRDLDLESLHVDLLTL